MLLAMAVSNRAQAAPKKATPNWTAENRHYALLHFLAGFGSRGAQIQEILRHLAERTGKTSYTAKTVYRDIEHLVDDFGYTIQHDKARNRWVFHNPPPNLTLGSRRLFSPDPSTRAAQAPRPPLPTAESSVGFHQGRVVQS